MTKLFFILLTMAVIVAAGAVTAQSETQDTSPDTETPQPTPDGCGALPTLSSETCALLGK